MEQPGSIAHKKIAIFSKCIADESDVCNMAQPLYVSPTEGDPGRNVQIEEKDYDDSTEPITDKPTLTRFFEKVNPFKHEICGAPATVPTSDPTTDPTTNPTSFPTTTPIAVICKDYELNYENKMDVIV